MVTLLVIVFAGELNVFKQPEGRAPASQGKAPKYELATHTVRVRRTGSLAEVMALWDLQGIEPTF